MGLIAWYPLTDNLNDYSGNNNHLSYYNDTNTAQIKISNSGKIGKCYEREVLNNGSNFFRSKNKVNLSGSFTMCCWAYVTDTDTSANGIVTNHDHIKFAGPGITIKHISASECRISCNTGNGNSRTFNTYCGTSNIKNRWAHLVMRYNADTKKIDLLVNGIVELTVAYTMYSKDDHIDVFNWSTTFTNSMYKPACRLNDVRIYDHALSIKEIKEIAKGKILHYTFNTMVEPTINLYSGKLNIYNNYKVPATLLANGTYKGQTIFRLGMTVTDEFSTYLSNFRTTLHSHGIYCTFSSFKAGRKYAASIFWKPVNKQDTVFGGIASNISGWTALPNEINYNGEEWNRFTAIRDGSSATDSSDNIFFSFCCPSLELNETIYIDVTCPQLEEYKDYSTEYTPDSRDYNIIRDSSGFGNDGTLHVTNTPRWIDDGNNKIGKGYYRFNGNNVIRANQLFFDNLNQCWTVCAWVYVDDNIVKHQRLNNFNLGNHIIYGYDNSSLLYINNNANDAYVYGKQQPTKQWYHIAYVLNSSIQRCEIYIDGKLSATSHNYAVSDIPAGFNEVTSFGQNFGGLMDDVRIYATDLSSEDILEIYQNRLSLDDSGNLYSNNLKERGNIAWKINNAIKNKKFENGLSLYNQPNLQVTLTDRGYRIYSPPNLIYPDAGNTMWGGLKINLFNAEPNAIQKGHKYRISITVTGKTSRSSARGIYFSNNMGWDGAAYGLSTSPAIHIEGNSNIPSNFNGTMTVKVIYDITDDVWKECINGGYPTFKEGYKYNCYRDLCFGFGYADTGPIGTDIYITDVHIEDITDINKGLVISDKYSISSSKFSEVSIADDLVAWWKLDGDTKDYSGNSIHGKINGGVSISNGLNGSSYLFNGVDGYISTIPKSILRIQENTFSIWINATDLNAWRGIFEIISNGSRKSRFMSFGDNEIRYHISYSDGAGSYVSFPNVPLNEWVHLVGTWDGSTIKTYMNGTKVDETSFTGTISYDRDPYIDIGLDPGRYFNGKMQDFRVYNRALTSEEISILYDMQYTNLKISGNGHIYIKGEVKEV